MLHFAYDATDSTNTRAAELAQTHPGAIILVTARTQTAGRGRSGRAWHSPDGGAWFTLVWPAARSAEVYEPAPLVVGLAVAEAIAHLRNSAAPGSAPSAILLKWPNDVLLDGRKVAGILCERHLEMPNAPCGALLLGVGINANLDPVTLGDDLHYPATSLRVAYGHDVDVAELIRRCAQAIRARLTALERAGLTDAVRTQIEARLAFLGRQISLDAAPGVITGTCRGIDSAGALLLETAAGVRALSVGEITPV